MDPGKSGMDLKGFGMELERSGTDLGKFGMDPEDLDGSKETPGWIWGGLRWIQGSLGWIQRVLVDSGKSGMDLKEFGMDLERSEVDPGMDPEAPGGSRGVQDGSGSSGWIQGIWGWLRRDPGKLQKLGQHPRISLPAPATSPGIIGNYPGIIILELLSWNYWEFSPPWESLGILAFGIIQEPWIEAEPAQEFNSHLPSRIQGWEFPNSQIPGRAGFPWDILSGASSSSSSSSSLPSPWSSSPEIQFIGAGNGFLGISAGFRKGNSPQKKVENSGLIQIFVGFFPVVWELFLSLGTGGEKFTWSLPCVHFPWKIHLKNWDLGLFSPPKPGFSGIMWNSGLDLVGKIPKYPQGSRGAEPWEAPGTRFSRLSRNSLNAPRILFLGKASGVGWEGFFRGIFGILIIFREIFLLLFEENPWIFLGFSPPTPVDFGISGFWELWESRDLLQGRNSLLGSEFNNFCGFFGKVNPQNSPFPGISTSIKPQFSQISLDFQ
nr:uncharacterized protein LOC121471118 [Taeniopygia guttata]